MKQIDKDLIKDLVAHHIFDSDYRFLNEDGKATVDSVIKERNLI